MKKNLEDWLRGDVPYPSGSIPSPDTLELKFPAASSPGWPLHSDRAPLPIVSSAVVHEEIPAPPAFSAVPEEVPIVDFLRSPADEPSPEFREPEPPQQAGELPETNFPAPPPVSPVLFSEENVDEDDEIPQMHDSAPRGQDQEKKDDDNDEDDKNDADDDKDYGVSDGEDEYPEIPQRVPESPEREAARFAKQLRRVEQMRRILGTGGRRPGFRRNWKRLFTWCLFLVLIAATTFALWKHLQRNSFDSLMADADEQYRQSLYEPAFEIYGTAASRYPARLEPLLGMAHSAERMGHIESAIEAYAATLHLIPAGASGARSGAFYETGRLYAVLKNRDKARENFEKAVELDSTNYNAFFALGNILEERGDLEKALPNYRRALDLSPSSDAAASAVKRIADRLNADKEAAAAAAAETQKYEQAVQTGSVAIGLQRYSEASQRFAEALAIRSDDATAWVGFADARKGLGDTAGAVKSLQRALERDPKNAEAQAKLDELTKADPQKPKKTPAPKRPQPRKKSRATPRSSTSLSTAGRPAALSRRELFEIGVERYRSEDYAEAFEAFLACLRSPDKNPLPDVPSIEEAGPLWRGYRVPLRVPSDMMRLSEALCLNPGDSNLYLNLALAGTRMKSDRKTLQETINDIYSHARTHNNNNNI